VVLLLLVVFPGQAQTLAPKESAAPGLVPKFVNVPALGGIIKTRYYEAGQGDPLLLVHGGGFAGYYSANVWSKNIPGLAMHFHVFAPDKLMSGMTDNPPDDKDYNIQGEVEHMYQFIQTMKLGKINLVGQSRGAGLAWLLAMAHPEVVKTLVLVDSATVSPPLDNANAHAELMAKCPKDRDESWKCEMRILSYGPNAMEAFPDDSFAPGIYMGNLPKSKTTMAKIRAGAGEPLSGQFEQYKESLHERLRNEVLLPMPVLLYWAKNDPQAPALKNGVAFFEILAAKQPNVRMIIVNNAGHFHFREYPDQFNNNVTNFIDYWNHASKATVGSKAK
jgi:pimeloyl-ACP methyl ester carboxylesterase